MGRKAGGMYINPKKFGGAGKPCMKEMLQFLGCLSLNNKKDDKCTKFKNLLVACAEEQVIFFPVATTLNHVFFFLKHLLYLE